MCPLPSIQPSVQRLADTKLPTTGQNGATWPVVESIAPDGLVAVRRAQNNRAVLSLTIGRVSFAASSGTHCRHASHLCGRQGRSPRRERPQLQAGNRCLPHGRASLHADAEGKHARGGRALRYAFAKLVAGGKPCSGLTFHLCFCPVCAALGTLQQLSAEASGRIQSAEREQEEAPVEPSWVGGACDTPELGVKRIPGTNG